MRERDKLSKTQMLNRQSTRMDSKKYNERRASHNSSVESSFRGSVDIGTIERPNTSMMFPSSMDNKHMRHKSGTGFVREKLSQL